MGTGGWPFAVEVLHGAENEVEYSEYSRMNSQYRQYCQYCTFLLDVVT